MPARARALRGEGPFVVFASSGAQGVEVYALDLGATDATPIFLGPVPTEETYPPIQGGDSLVAFPYDEDSFALLSRDARLGDRILRAKGFIRAVAVSPDSRWVAVASTVGEDDNSARVTLHRVDGSVPPRRLATFGTSSDLSGGTFAMFWSGRRSVTIVDECHCDGGGGYVTTSRLSLSGRRRELSFLEGHSPVDPGPQSGGSLFAFDDTPNVDCFERPKACENLLQTSPATGRPDASLRSL